MQHFSVKQWYSVQQLSILDECGMFHETPLLDSTHNMLIS